MTQSAEEKITSAFVGILADEFNRSLNALEHAGEINTTVLKFKYKTGSEYYKLSAAASEITANYARPGNCSKLLLGIEHRRTALSINASSSPLVVG